MIHEEQTITIAILAEQLRELLALQGHDISPAASRDLIEHAVTQGVMLAIA
ncbi:hypothetical protein [Lonsdalea britannica]|uniref:hypothetical protein n=1 Tax=Lonsdalea britannica TaxID=1082704 RepID=UPI0013C2C181|nr:hypothetical protein [Lonsdalea britannica]